MKSKGKRERYIQLNAEFRRIARRDKKGFFNEQCLIIEGNSKTGKIKDLFRKTGNINSLRYADDTTLTAEELKSLLMRVKEDSERAG